MSTAIDDYAERILKPLIQKIRQKEIEDLADPTILHWLYLPTVNIVDRENFWWICIIANWRLHGLEDPFLMRD